MLVFIPHQVSVLRKKGNSLTTDTPHSENGRCHQKHQCSSKLVDWRSMGPPKARVWLSKTQQFGTKWRLTEDILHSLKLFYPTAILPPSPRPCSTEMAVAEVQAPRTQHAHTATTNMHGRTKGAQPHLQGGSEGQSSPK